MTCGRSPLEVALAEVSQEAALAELEDVVKRVREDPEDGVAHLERLRDLAVKLIAIWQRPTA